MDARIMVRLDGELNERLKAAAKAQDRPVSRLIRQGITELLDHIEAETAPQPPPAKRQPRARTKPGPKTTHVFTPQKGNALKCATCGGRKAEHR